jgi:hypothetical protein
METAWLADWRGTGVDVLMTASDLTSVRAPSMSTTNGCPAVRVMMVCRLNTFRPSRVQLAIPVDELTAHRFQRTCRELTMLRHIVGPAVVIIGLAVTAIGMVGRAGGDRALARGCFWMELALVTVVLIVNVLHRLRRSRHHPRVGRGGTS